MGIKKKPGKIHCPAPLGGGDLLSHFRSTIGAVRFNFSVRNGKRWNPHAVPALVRFYRPTHPGGRCMVKAICGNARNPADLRPSGLQPPQACLRSRLPEGSAGSLKPASRVCSCFFSVSAATAADTLESFGQLVPLGTGLAALTPAAYRRRSLRRPSWRSHLGGGFVLRCFQHLSLPDAATRRCTWRHNRLTGGLSNTVLSY